MGAIAVANVSSTLELSKQFMAHAEAVFAFHSLSLAPEGRYVLRQDFNNGASRMGEENRLSPEDIGVAHHSVGLYATAIVVSAKTSENFNPDDGIQANIIQKVKDFFCPGFFPFC
jgi:hypothetical protein